MTARSLPTNAWWLGLLLVSLSIGCRSRETLTRDDPGTEEAIPVSKGGCALLETLPRNDGDEVRVRTNLAAYYPDFDEYARQQREDFWLRNPRGRGPGPPSLTSDKVFWGQNYVVVYWVVSHACGEHPSPKVDVGERLLRFTIVLSGSPRSDCGREITNYRTSITHLPAGRYRLLIDSGYEPRDLMVTVPGRAR